MEINNEEWKEFLLNNQPNKNFKEHFIKKLKENVSENCQIFHEMETAYRFNHEFGISIIDFNKKTIKNKDVDLLANLDDEKIYIEITGSKYKEDKNNDGQQDAKIARALKHGNEKFSENEVNLLAVYDEQDYSLFSDQKFIYDNFIYLWFRDNYISVEGYENIDLKKISGLLLFSSIYAEDNKRSFMLYKNPNSLKSNEKLFDILSKSPLCVDFIQDDEII